MTSTRAARGPSPFDTERSALGARLRRMRRTFLILLERCGEELLLRRELMIRPDVKRLHGDVVVTAAGGGSVGDEAMYQAFASNALGPTVIWHHRVRDEFAIDPSHYGARSMIMPDLVYGRSVWKHLCAVRSALFQLRGMRSLSIVGADMMDGVYNERAAARRFRLAGLAARLQLDSRILGFSWVDAPTPIARAALRRVRPAVRLCARDRVSSARLSRDGASNVCDVADLAFLTDPTRSPHCRELWQWMRQQEGAGRPVVLINANPRIAVTYPEQESAYIELVSRLISGGYSCLMLSNDSRGGHHSETAYLKELFEANLGDPRVHLVSHVLLPGDVVEVAESCILTVTGRMHLVILSAVGGTPSVALEYQGKFEGLYELLGFDLRVGALENPDTLSEIVFRAIEKAGEYRETLSHRRSRLIDLARLNLPADE